jgi:hypothetical protein
VVNSLIKPDCPVCQTGLSGFDSSNSAVSFVKFQNPLFTPSRRHQGTFSVSVSEHFELVGMRRQVITFQNRPSLNDLVARVRDVGRDLRLHGRYDMCGNISIYVMLLLESEDE